MSVAIDDAPRSRQSDAHARKLALAVQPLEGAEQLVCVDHVEADPVVVHEQARFAVYLLASDLAGGMAVIAGELPRIADEVAQQDPDQADIA